MSETCLAITKAGSPCKNRATRWGFCSRHLPVYQLPEKSIFRLVVDEKNISESFEHVRKNPSSESARWMLDDMFQEYVDRDGNFVEQFQTTGFDARLFELFLFAYFSRSGFSIDTTNAVPDFLIERGGLRVAVEATTVNPSTAGVVKEMGRTYREVSQEELTDFFENELPIRFGSPLFAKIKKRYWEKPHCKGLPFVIAIEAFHEADAQLLNDSSLIRYLYGAADSGSRDANGNLVVTRETVEDHQLGPKKVPTGFFSQPDSEHISAVLFTNSGTLAKFSRMGYQHGYGCETVVMERRGLWFNPDRNARDSTLMFYNTQIRSNA